MTDTTSISSESDPSSDSDFACHLFPSLPKEKPKPRSTSTNRWLRPRCPSNRVDYNVENQYLALNTVLEPETGEKQSSSGKGGIKNSTRVRPLKRSASQAAVSKNLESGGKKGKSANGPHDKPGGGRNKDMDEGVPDRAGEFWGAAEETEKQLSTTMSHIPDLLWSPVHAHLLQQSWTARDRAALQRHCSANRKELVLWELVPRIFGRSLPDLFTYGLKLDDSVLPDIHADGQALPNPGFLSAAVSDNLQLLLCHPVWEGSLSLVRYALQVAIMNRVPGHIFPIAPLPNLKSRVDVMKNAIPADQPALARDIDFASYEMSHPCARRTIRQLCDILEESVEKEDRHEGEGDDGFREKTLFLLRAEDIQAVINAANRLAVNGMPVFRTCHDYFLHHKSLVQAERDGRGSPDEVEALKRHNKEWVLATRRRWITSSRHWRRGSAGDAPAVDEPGAYDIPEGDACPTHLYCEQLGRSEAHLALLRGTVWPLSKTPPPVFCLATKEKNLGDKRKGGQRRRKAGASFTTYARQVRYDYYGPTTISYDGSDADSLHPPGLHRFYGAVVMNWHAVSTVSHSGPTEYVYYAPATINYIGFATFAAAMPGTHTFYNRVAINYTAPACAGPWRRNTQGVRREFYSQVDYSRILPGATVPGWEPDAPGADLASPSFPPWGHAHGPDAELTEGGWQELPREEAASRRDGFPAARRALSRSLSTPGALSALDLQQQQQEEEDDMSGPPVPRRWSAPGDDGPMNDGPSRPESESDRLEWPSLISGLLSDEPLVP
ncbi:hypothetical protein VTH06DRAFT_4080 [Thermothelomyces fergusii]